MDAIVIATFALHVRRFIGDWLSPIERVKNMIKVHSEAGLLLICDAVRRRSVERGAVADTVRLSAFDGKRRVCMPVLRWGNQGTILNGSQRIAVVVRRTATGRAGAEPSQRSVEIEVQTGLDAYSPWCRFWLDEGCAVDLQCISSDAAVQVVPVSEGLASLSRCRAERDAQRAELRRLRAREMSTSNRALARALRGVQAAHGGWL